MTTASSGSDTTNSTTAALLTELSSQISQAFFSSATTEAPEGEDPQPEPDAGAHETQRRQLLIGIICLAVALIVVIAAIGFFFYKVCPTLLCYLFLDMAYEFVKFSFSQLSLRLVWHYFYWLPLFF